MSTTSNSTPEQNLIFACQTGNFAMVKTLFESKQISYVNAPLSSSASGTTAFMLACASQAPLDQMKPILDFLILQGADFTKTNKDGLNAAFYIANPALVGYLASKGVDLGCPGTDVGKARGGNVLHWLAVNQKNTAEYRALVKAFIDNKVSLTRKAQNGDTPELMAKKSASSIFLSLLPKPSAAEEELRGEFALPAFPDQSPHGSPNGMHYKKYKLIPPQTNKASPSGSPVQTGSPVIKHSSPVVQTTSTTTPAAEGFTTEGIAATYKGGTRQEIAAAPLTAHLAERDNSGVNSEAKGGRTDVKDKEKVSEHFVPPLSSQKPQNTATHPADQIAKQSPTISPNTVAEEEFTPEKIKGTYKASNAKQVAAMLDIIKVDINQPLLEDHRTPLMFAALNKEHGIEVIAELLRRGADINILDVKDRNILFYAHSLNIAKYLVEEKNININHRNLDGSTFLHYLASHKEDKYSDIVEFLLSKGADATIKNTQDKTPLDCANENNNKTTKALLTAHLASKAEKGPIPIQHDKKMSDKDDPAVHIKTGKAKRLKPTTEENEQQDDDAIHVGPPPAISLKRKAEKQKAPKETKQPKTSVLKYTPLIIATMRNDIEKMEELIKDGADVNQLDPQKSKKTAIFFAQSKEAVKALAKGGKLNLNHKDHNHATALHKLAWAQKHGSIDDKSMEETIKALLELGADYNSIKNPRGKTAIQAAGEAKNIIFINAVKQYELQQKKPAAADTNDVHEEDGEEAVVHKKTVATKKTKTTKVPNRVEIHKGDTPLIIACKENNTTKIQELMDNGANVHEVNDQSRSAIFFARTKKAVEILASAKGCNVAELVNKTDRNGSTALHALAIVNTKNTPQIDENDLRETILKLLELGANLNAKNYCKSTPTNSATKKNNKVFLETIKEFNSKQQNKAAADAGPAEEEKGVVADSEEEDTTEQPTSPILTANDNVTQADSAIDKAADQETEATKVEHGHVSETPSASKEPQANDNAEAASANEQEQAAAASSLATNLEQAANDSKKSHTASEAQSEHNQQKANDNAQAASAIEKEQVVEPASAVSANLEQAAETKDADNGSIVPSIATSAAPSTPTQQALATSITTPTTNMPVAAQSTPASSFGTPSPVKPQMARATSHEELLLDACKNGNEEAVSDILGEHFLSINVNCQELTSGKTPLHYAAENKALGIMTLLVGAGARKNVKDSSQKNPLFYANKHGAGFVRQVIEKVFKEEDSNQQDSSFTCTTFGTPQYLHSPLQSYKDVSQPFNSNDFVGTHTQNSGHGTAAGAGAPEHTEHE